MYFDQGEIPQNSICNGNPDMRRVSYIAILTLIVFIFQLNSVLRRRRKKEDWTRFSFHGFEGDE